MPSLAHLRPIIEQKSRAPTVQCTVAAMRDFFGFDPAAMRRDACDSSTIEMHEQFYERFESFAAHPLIGEYLTTLTPTDSYEASGIWVATLRGIREAAFSGGLDSDLFPHGYLAVAGDGVGNSVCFHSRSGRVIFAHHELTEDIIAGEVEVLSGDIATFLDDLLHDKLTERLDELD
jgi:hypothetical protein